MSNVLFSKTDSLPGYSSVQSMGLVAVDADAGIKVFGGGNAYSDLVKNARKIALQQLEDIAMSNGYAGFILYQENVTYSAVGNHAIVSVTAEAVVNN